MRGPTFCGQPITLPEFLYRLYDADGGLLYVGITGSVRARMQHHALKSRWWPLVANLTIETHPDRLSVEAAERRVVATESPRFNVMLQETRDPAEVEAADARAAAALARQKDLAERRADLDTSELARLGDEWKRTQAELDALIPELGGEIRAAAADGMPQVEIARLTGYTRDQIRQICLPPERRRTRASAG